MDIVQIGLIYNKMDENSWYSIEGWHVDSLVLLEGADQFLIYPKTPQHCFSGILDNQVYRYRFESKAHADQYIPVEG